MSDDKPIESTGSRGLWFGVFTGLCLLAIAAFVGLRLMQSHRAGPDSAASSAFVPTPEFLKLRETPHFFFRSASSGEYFGRAVMAPLAAPDESRVATPMVCDRVHFAHGRGICLLGNRKSIQPPAVATIFDENLRVLHTVPLAGAPSRARVSPDGHYAASTVFVTGDNYATSFSTRSSIIDIDSGKVILDLEELSVTRDDKPFREIDMNYWGVTFARDSDRFYATVATGGKTFLLEANVAARTARVLTENVECPSLSPNGSRIAYKQRVSASAGWRLHVLELATMHDATIEAETRSIDDQVEWLDDYSILYGFVDAKGSPEEAMNVWLTSTNAEAQPTAPTLFIHGASSPVVVK